MSELQRNAYEETENSRNIENVLNQVRDQTLTHQVSYASLENRDVNDERRSGNSIVKLENYQSEARTLWLKFVAWSALLPREWLQGLFRDMEALL